MKRDERLRTILGTIKKYQTIKGVTDETLAIRIGMTQNTFITRKNHPENFSAGELIEIYDFLGVPNEPVQERIF